MVGKLSARRAGLALMYHGVGPRTGDPAAELVPDHGAALFEAQIRHLARRYDPVTASALPEAIARRRRGDRVPVAVTFDDDLRSHATVAAPILQRLGVQATFFVGGAALDGPSGFWWTRMQRAWDRGRRTDVERIVAASAGAPASPTLRELADRVEALPPAARDAVADALLEPAGPDPTDAGLRAEDLAGLATAGFEIGFHTLRHHRLTGLDDAALAAAVTEGGERVADIAGARPCTIAYPHGKADARVAAAAERAGFTAGYMSWGGRVTPDDAAADARSTRAVVCLEDAVCAPARAAAARSGAGARGLSSPGVSAARRIADLGRRALPAGARRRIKARGWHVWPPVGRLRLGSLGRTAPISRNFGFERGLPIDRHYIERFLDARSADITGHVLEIGDATYTRRFGRGVTEIDVLHIDEGVPGVTIEGDLASGENLPSATFDCVVCTQTLLFVYDVPAAIATIERILKPGGVALVTVPGISQICRSEADTWGDFWRFTSMSARRLFEASFPPSGVTVEAHGNVLAATGFLHGLAVEDLDVARLEVHDPDFELVIALRAQKPAAT